MLYVLDACALMRFVNREPGHERVTGLFRRAQDGADQLLMHPINFGEVIYLIARRSSWKTAQEFKTRSTSLPFSVAPYTDDTFWAAVKIKADHPLAYADAFAAALAIERDATLLTSDHEFAPLKGMLKVEKI